MTKISNASRFSPLAVEQAIEECIVSRRNFYLGLWAGRRLGLPEGALRDYAYTVVVADYEEPGNEDVIRKLAADFAARGEGITRDEILAQLRRTYVVAARQFAMTD